MQCLLPNDTTKRTNPNTRTYATLGNPLFKIALFGLCLLCRLDSEGPVPIQTLFTASLFVVPVPVIGRAVYPRSAMVVRCCGTVHLGLPSGEQMAMADCLSPLYVRKYLGLCSLVMRKDGFTPFRIGFSHAFRCTLTAAFLWIGRKKWKVGFGGILLVFRGVWAYLKVS